MLPFSAFISMIFWFFLPDANLDASMAPMAPFSNSTAAAIASSTSTSSFFFVSGIIPFFYKGLAYS